MQRCLKYLAALGVAVLIGCPGVASAATPSGAVISNGTVQLGVTLLGDLNYDCGSAGDSDCPGNSANGTPIVGLRYVPLSTEATADGCTCEGWGVADAGSGLSGWANTSRGDANVFPISLVATPSTAVVTTDVSDVSMPGYSLRVVHDYHPSAISPNLYEVTVSITNTGVEDVTDLRYRRIMDWDIEPSPFHEWVTVANTAASRQLLFDSDNGFASSNALAFGYYSDSEAVCGGGYTGPCDFTNLGSGGEYPSVTQPSDHGALFDFGFGSLAPGATRSFQTYYGAAPSRADALAAIAAQGIGVYSLGEPDCGANAYIGVPLCVDDPPFNGVTDGLPNTFTFGFLTADADVGVTAGASPEPVLTGSHAVASFTVKNHGLDATPGAVLTIPLPAGTAYVDAVPSHGSCVYADPDVVCSLGALGNGASAGVRLTVAPSVAGTYRLVATASSPANDDDASNDADSVSVVASDILVTPLPPAKGAATPGAPPGGPFMVQVQFRVPKSCAAPCAARAQLTLRNGTTLLGSRAGLSLKGAGHVRFNVTVDKAALLAADGVVNAKGYRTTLTRMVVGTLGAGGRWSNTVKVGRIAVAVGRIASGNLPRDIGKVF